ncbi:hypothetical protein [Hyalangium versicolor]|uniref:hypothetical protein n=1 Tax=Hyalangium versicolor TaxID=2861190 RepID=UPI001CCD7079|nr:hypothetical protein [Hyalangium versicolor]
MRWASQRDGNEPAIVRALQLAGWTVVKVNAPGVMDLLCIRRGELRVLEVKNPRGKNRLTRAQEELLARLRAAGLEVPVVRSPEEALAAVEGRPPSPEPLRSDADNPARTIRLRARPATYPPGRRTS